MKIRTRIVKIKLSVLLIFCSSLFSSVYSQTFMHSVGGTISVLGSKGEILTTDFLGIPYYKSYNFIMEAVALTYFPRLNFETGNKSSFSVGIPLSLGIGAASDINKENSGVYFSYDLPVIADFNIGLGATRENEKRFGYFLGAGFGYGHVSLALTSGSEKINSYGPIGHGGVRFKIGSIDSNRGFGKDIVIGLFYKPRLDKYKFKTFGVQVLTDL